MDLDSPSHWNSLELGHFKFLSGTLEVSATAPLSLAQPCSVHLSLFKQRPCILYSHTPCLDLLAITDSYAEQVSGHVRDRVDREMGSQMNGQINEWV